MELEMEVAEGLSITQLLFLWMTLPWDAHNEMYRLKVQALCIDIYNNTTEGGMSLAHCNTQQQSELGLADIDIFGYLFVPLHHTWNKHLETNSNFCFEMGSHYQKEKKIKPPEFSSTIY